MTKRIIGCLSLLGALLVIHAGCDKFGSSKPTPSANKPPESKANPKDKPSGQPKPDPG